MTLPSSVGSAAGGAAVPADIAAALYPETPRRCPPWGNGDPRGGRGCRGLPCGAVAGRVSIGASAICFAVLMERAIRRYTLACAQPGASTSADWMRFLRA